MASDQLPFKKRSNPLEGTKTLGSISSIREAVAEEEIKQHVEPVIETPKSAEVEKPRVVEKPTHVSRPVSKPVAKPVVTSEGNRDKYTATMERELRINVKIASAKRGLQFSQFIEEAVREKIEREGL